MWDSNSQPLHLSFSRRAPPARRAGLQPTKCFIMRRDFTIKLTGFLFLVWDSNPHGASSHLRATLISLLHQLSVCHFSPTRNPESVTNSNSILPLSPPQEGERKECYATASASSFFSCTKNVSSFTTWIPTSLRASAPSSARLARIASLFGSSLVRT